MVCSVHKAILGTIHVIKSVVKHQTDMFNTHWAIMWWFYNVFMQMFYNVFKQLIGNEIIEKGLLQDFIRPTKWAPAGIFSEGSETAWADKNDIFFGEPRARMKSFAIVRRLGPYWWVFDASAEAASENSRVFCTESACDIIIFKFQRGQLPLPPSAYGPTRLISNIPRA